MVGLRIKVLRLVCCSRVWSRLSSVRPVSHFQLVDADAIFDIHGPKQKRRNFWEWLVMS